MRIAAASGLAVVLIATTRAAAQPPGEVPPDASFGSDRETLSWSAVAGADGYDVYRGTSPAAYDQACRIYRSASTSAALSEVPQPGALFYFLVSAVDADGEGTLGDGSTGPRPNTARCADADGDLAPDNLDNCPAAPNPTQADQ